MNKNILIVNYEPKSLLKLEKLITGAGLNVTSAKDGVEALESVEQKKPDLLIIDPMLPKLSGFEVSKKVSEKHPEIPIIIITSVYKGIKYRNEALTKYGAKDFFEIPFDENQLLSRVKELLKIENKESSQKASTSHKKSSKKRLEDILEQTMSGSLKDLQKHDAKKVKPKDDGVVFTSEEIFSDVISDVEKTNDIDVKPKKSSKKSFINSDSVNLEVENQLEKTLSGLKIGKKATKKDKPKKPEPEIKKSAAVVETKLEEKASVKEEVAKEAKKTTEEGIEYGSYVLLEKVATGGMAELFKAKRRGVQGFQKIVAIKRILSHLVDNEDFVTMFIDEAKLAAQLNHPNIAQIYDLGKIEKSFYIAMEYVEGYDLRNIFKECQKKKVFMPEPLILYVASKILSALDYAHRKKGLDMKDLKIVHRDVSPQNILISKDGDVKLVDFGIAKAATKASQTQAGALKGKLLYMSPEQAWGKAIDNRSDLFSLGSVLYEGLTDKKCFLADSEISILEKVRSAQYDPIEKLNSKISKNTIDIVSKSLAKESDERYQNAKEMEQEIGKMLDSLPFAVRERELAEFIEALYNNDSSKINEINKKLSIEEEEKVFVETPIVEEAKVEEVKPETPKVQFEEPEEVEKPKKSKKQDTSTVIMPDIEKVEQHEEEMIENLGPSKSNTGLFIGVAAIILIAIVGYFFIYPKLKGKNNQTNKATEITKKVENPTTPPVKTEEEKTSEAKTANTLNEEDKKPVAEKTPADTKTTKNSEKVKKEESTPLSSIDQQKLIDELTQKKIAASQAAIKDKIQKDAEKRKLELQKQIEQANKEKELLAQKIAADEEKKKKEEAAKETAKEELNKEVTTNTQVQKPIEEKTENKQAEVVAKPEEKQIEEKPVEIQQPKLKEGDLVPLIEGEVEFPVVLNRVEPKKTAAARRMKIRGVIVAQMLIDENGEIKDVRILRNIPGKHGLDKQVIKALKQWRFKPAVKNGVRVSVYYTQTFSF